MKTSLEQHTRAIKGAALEVHDQLGPGYLEPVYQEALAMEFGLRSIPYQREVHVPVFYKGRKLAQRFRADFLCYDAVVIELKAIPVLTNRDDAQLLNYLKATDRATGILFNFGQRWLQVKQVRPAGREPHELKRSAG